MVSPHIQQAARDAQSNTLMLSACGGCSECHERRPPKKHGRDGGVVHALELMPRNRELLRNISRDANVSDIVYIHALAGQRYGNGKAERRRGQARRRDGGGMHAGRGLHALDGGGGARRLLRAHRRGVSGHGGGRHGGMGRARRRGHAPLARRAARWRLHLRVQLQAVYAALGRPTLDCTGTVPQSATHAFAPRPRADWASPDPSVCRSLAALLAWVGAEGYECFFQTRHFLVPANGPCVPAAPDLLASEIDWSNLLCAVEPPVLEVLRKFVPGDGAQLATSYFKQSKAYQLERILNASAMLPPICTLHILKGGRRSAARAEEEAPLQLPRATGG